MDKKSDKSKELLSCIAQTNQGLLFHSIEQDKKNAVKHIKSKEQIIRAMDKVTSKENI